MGEALSSRVLYAGNSRGVCTEIGKKAWLFAKLQPGRARKRVNATYVGSAF